MLNLLYTLPPITFSGAFCQPIRHNSVDTTSDLPAVVSTLSAQRKSIFQWTNLSRTSSETESKCSLRKNAHVLDIFMIKCYISSSYLHLHIFWHRFLGEPRSQPRNNLRTTIFQVLQANRTNISHSFSLKVKGEKNIDEVLMYWLFNRDPCNAL